MAEYASAVAGLLALSLHITHKVVQYASSAKNAKTSISKLRDEFCCLNTTLKDLETSLAKSEKQLDSDSSLALTISCCKKWMEDFEGQIPEVKSKDALREMFHRLKWPFEEAGTIQAAQAVGRFTQILQFSLTVKGFDLLLQANSKAVEDIKELVKQATDVVDDNQAKISIRLDEIADFLAKIPDMMMALVDIQHKLKLVEETTSSTKLDAEFIRFLDWIPGSTYHKERHQQLQLSRLQNSAQWFISSDVFKGFLKGETRILWCPGAPGSGKTYLASIIIDNLYYWARTSTPRGHVAYFYFSYRRQDNQRPQDVLNCLLRQILTSHGEIPKSASELYRPFQYGECLPQWDTLKTILARICTENEARTFVILDALDECASERDRFEIFDLVDRLTMNGVSVCITSRDFAADINERLGKEKTIHISAREEDVRRTLTTKMKGRQITRHIGKELQDEIIRKILLRSSGMYLLPSLMIDTVLDQTNDEEVRAVLDRLPSSLDDFYDFTIKVRFGDPGKQPRARLAIETMLWVSHAFRPLRLNEIHHATAVVGGLRQSKELRLSFDKDILISSCHGLIMRDSTDSSTATVNSPNPKILFVHQSVNEYILEHRGTLYQGAHKRMAIACLTYLLLDDFAQNVPRTFRQIMDLVERLPFVFYAAEYWGHHAREAKDAEVDNLAIEFLKKRPPFPNWILDSSLYEKSGMGHSIPDTDFAAVPRTLDLVYSDVLLEHNYGFGELDEFLDEKSIELRYRTKAIHVAARFGLSSPIVHLIEKEEDVNYQDVVGNTAFMLAAKFGHVDFLRELHEHSKLDMNATNYDGQTALILAIAEDKREAVEYLLQLPELDVNKSHPLAFAINGASEVIALQLMQRSDLDINGKGDHEKSRRPFWDALAQLFFDAVKASLAHPDLLPFIDRINFGVEHHPISSVMTIWIEGFDIMNDQEIIRSLMLVDMCIEDERIGPTVPERTRIVWYWNCFQEAITENRTAVTAWLREQGITANYQDLYGNTFLHIISPLTSHKTIENLLEQGGEELVGMADSDGWTALHEAVSEDDADELIKLLLKHGADPNAHTKSGWYILHAALGRKQISYIETLLAHGANVNNQSQLGWTPLHLAVELSKNSEIVSLLLKHGAEPNARSLSGHTALHCAVWNDISEEPCQQLLALGLDVDAITFGGHGSTALHIAVASHNANFVRVLIEAEADPTILGYYGVSALDLAAGDSELWEALTPRWTELYIRTTPAVEHAHRKEAIRFTLTLCLEHSSEINPQKSFLGSLARLLLYDGAEAEAVIAFRSMITTCRYPIGKRECVCTPCNVCKSVALPCYICKSCIAVHFCEGCMGGYPREEVRWCRGHEFLKLDCGGWKDVEGGVIKEGLRVEDWIREILARYEERRSGWRETVWGAVERVWGGL